MWPRLLSATAKLGPPRLPRSIIDRKSTRLNSSHSSISYAVFCLNETSTTDISTLSLHDALPICVHRRGERGAVAAAEIDHPGLRRPRERVVREIAGGGTVADDVAAAAQRHGEARATEATEVYHPALRRPREGMVHGIAGGETVADDLAAGVHGVGDAGGAAEGAEIDHPSRPRPRERMEHEGDGRVTVGDHLAVEVYRTGDAAGATEGAEGEHPGGGRPRDRMYGVAMGGGGAVADNLAPRVH